LLTILEVVIHDPLYKWLLSPLQARERQGHGQRDNDDKDMQIQREKEKVKEKGKKNNNAKIAEKTEKANLDNFQREIGGAGRNAAERTLQRIRSKLQGFEDPTSGGLSVEGQVEFLINESRSVDNLSKLFVGWSPWL
jgi:serine-protein kinase ATM